MGHGGSLPLSQRLWLNDCMRLPSFKESAARLRPKSSGRIGASLAMMSAQTPCDSFVGCACELVVVGAARLRGATCFRFYGYARWPCLASNGAAKEQRFFLPRVRCVRACCIHMLA